MTSIPIVLKKDKRGAWNLHAPKGHVIGGPFKGNEFDALAWGTIICFILVQYDGSAREKRRLRMQQLSMY